MLYWYSVVLIRNEVIAVKLESNHHSVFLMHYHLVLVVKYRRKVFDEKTQPHLDQLLEVHQRLQEREQPVVETGVSANQTKTLERVFLEP